MHGAVKGLFWLLLFAPSWGLEVIIDYSFYLPEFLGIATTESAGCCPYGHLPDNDTKHMVAPTVFGIGVQKGGTTSLYEYLKNHHQLYGTIKELHFLDDGGDKDYARYLKRWKYNRKGPRRLVQTGNKTYSEFVPPKTGSLFEISPSYMFVPFAACKAKVIAPNGKFIVFLRDPVDRAYSGFSFAFNRNWRKRKVEADWMRQTFWSVMQQGLREIASEPACDFQTGTGMNSYNDCVGCMLRHKDLIKLCAGRQFVEVGDQEYKCTFVGKEHVLRGMYGPQLAWWFTLLHPSQFRIFNSADFFSSPMTVLRQIGFFLDLHPTYAKWMIKRTRNKANAGRYRKENQTEVDYAKSVLREFYRRPNMELYRLLQETGHEEFRPFEDIFEEDELIDCTEPQIAQSGLCGDPRFLIKDPKRPPIDDRLPQAVSEAIGLYSASNPPASTKTATSLASPSPSQTMEPTSPPEMSEAAAPNSTVSSHLPEADTNEEPVRVSFQEDTEEESDTIQHRDETVTPSETESESEGKKGDAAEMLQPMSSTNTTTIRVMVQPNAFVIQRNFQSGLLHVDRFIHLFFAALMTFLLFCVWHYSRRRNRN